MARGYGGEVALDRWGRDPTRATQWNLLGAAYRSWFRVEWEGTPHLPREGGALLVSNHAGMMPVDGALIQIGVEEQLGRLVYLLAHHGFYRFPFMGRMMQRAGTVCANPDNAHRLLREDGRLVLVFPEGEKGPVKPPSERYKLQRFGRGGFVRLALRTQTPIVPVAIVGAEETNPMLARLESVAKPLGVPYVPITPTFPLLGPLGLLPAPTKWKIVFGEPIPMTEGAESERDELLVARLAERVRGAIQEMLDGAVRERKSVIFG